MQNYLVFLEEGLDKPTILDKLFPSIPAFVIQFVVLIIMIVAVFFLAYKPIRKILDKRKEHIDESIKSASKNKELTEIELRQAKDNVIASEEKANQIVEQAKVEALEAKSKILEGTMLEVEKMKQEADEDIEQSYRDSIDEIKKEIVNVALDTSKEMLKREINEKDNQKIIKEFLSKVGEKDDE